MIDMSERYRQEIVRLQKRERTLSYTIVAMAVALVVGYVMYGSKSNEVVELKESLTDTERQIALAQIDAGRHAVQMDACGRVVRRANMLIESKETEILNFYDDKMPALAREAFLLGTQRDEEELFFGVIRGLDFEEGYERLAASDLRNYGWAPRTSLEQGDENMAAICLGVDDEALFS